MVMSCKENGTSITMGFFMVFLTFWQCNWIAQWIYACTSAFCMHSYIKFKTTINGWSHKIYWTRMRNLIDEKPQHHQKKNSRTHHKPWPIIISWKLCIDLNWSGNLFRYHIRIPTTNVKKFIASTEPSTRFPQKLNSNLAFFYWLWSDYKIKYYMYYVA